MILPPAIRVVRLLVEVRYDWTAIGQRFTRLVKDVAAKNSGFAGFADRTTRMENTENPLILRIRVLMGNVQGFYSLLSQFVVVSSAAPTGTIGARIEIRENEGVTMTRSRVPDFEDDQEMIAFMAKHDGFELLDQGLAEIVETPTFQRKGQIELDRETLQLLDEIVAVGICTDPKEAVARAVHSYVLAIFPQSYKLVREN